MKNNPWDNLDPKKKKEEKSEPDFSNSKKQNTSSFFQLEDIMEDSMGFFKKTSGFSIVLLGLLAFFLWSLTGIFTVNPEEMSIVTRFGKYSRTVGPGLHYRMPFPIERNYSEVVTRIRTTRVGKDISLSEANQARNDNGLARSAYMVMGNDNTERLVESLMLTGDENIIDMQFEVQWRVKDLKSYLFNISDQAKTISNVSQSVVREIVAKNTLSDIITRSRSIIEKQATESLQEILDNYASGIEVIMVQMLRADPPLPVIDAFRDVQTARVEKESLVNMAESYRNDIVPKSRGDAQKIIQDAEAYAIETVNAANGESRRFLDVYEQYKNAKYVTRKRIYLDTMEHVFKDSEKVIVDESAGKGVLPLLSIDSKRLMNGNSRHGSVGNEANSGN